MAQTGQDTKNIWTSEEESIIDAMENLEHR
jgi:hypothetical protein